MQIYIHYNLAGGNPDAHTAIKNKMKDLQYLDYFTTNSIAYYLPNASLWHRDKPSCEAAYTDLNGIIAEFNKNRTANDRIILERCIALPFSGWYCILGQPHAS